jgi:hypothetical protein
VHGYKMNSTSTFHIPYKVHKTLQKPISHYNLHKELKKGRWSHMPFNIVRIMAIFKNWRQNQELLTFDFAQLKWIIWKKMHLIKDLCSHKWP